MLEARISPVQVVEFGRLIGARLKAQGREASTDQLRSQSARIVSAQDVAALDTEVVEEIAGWLTENHVLIASHAVTHEEYGVRVTAFSQQNLAKLPLSAIVVLQPPPEVLVARVESNSQGRTWHTSEQAQRLQSLQTALALTYGVVCGCPVYVFDVEMNPNDLADEVLSALQSDGIFR